MTTVAISAVPALTDHCEPGAQAAKPAHLGLLGGLVGGLIGTVAVYVGALSTALSAEHAYSDLARQSDAELAALGLERAGIVTAVKVAYYSA